MNGDLISHYSIGSFVKGIFSNKSEQTSLQMAQEKQAQEQNQIVEDYLKQKINISQAESVGGINKNILIMGGLILGIAVIGVTTIALIKKKTP